MDSIHSAHELASRILQSSSPADVASSIAAVRSFLTHHSADQSRPFFTIAFPALICKVFGYDASLSQKPQPPLGWIDCFQNGDLARDLFDLFAPSSLLFSWMVSADRRSLVKFVFPVERLPEWVKVVIGNDRYRPFLLDLCPLFGSRIKEGSGQVQVNVFEYYIFWFAYYPISRGKGENSVAPVTRKNTRFRLDKWTSSLAALHTARKETGSKTEMSLYCKLLYSYLSAFVPVQRLSSSAYPYRGSLLRCSSDADSYDTLRAEFVIYTLVQFWLVDNDFSPVPVNVQQSIGVSIAFCGALDALPPSASTGEILILFEYLNCSAAHVNDTLDARLKNSAPNEFARHGYHLEQWNLLLRRPMYRYILRTFRFCPVGSSIKNVAAVFNLWMNYLEPWKINLKRYTVLDEEEGKVKEDQWHASCSPNHQKINQEDENLKSSDIFTPKWEGFVVSNYLFYTSLVLYFLSFSHKFLHVDLELILQMALKVLTILLSHGELLFLLKKLDTAYHSKSTGSSSILDPLHKYVPSIREQLQDWEVGLSEKDGCEGPSLLENGSHTLKFFSDAEDSGKQLLQLLILRAETEAQSFNGEKRARCLQHLDSLKPLVVQLFGPSEKFKSLRSKPAVIIPTRDEVFTPKHPGVGKCTWDGVKYKGDWMKRPITDGEVAWLVGLLVRMSNLANNILGLDHGGTTHPTNECQSSLGSSRRWRNVELSTAELDVDGAKDFMNVLACSTGSWVMMVCRALQSFMRDHDMRVNLRFLASKKVCDDFSHLWDCLLCQSSSAFQILLVEGRCDSIKMLRKGAPLGEKKRWDSGGSFFFGGSMMTMMMVLLTF